MDQLLKSLLCGFLCILLGSPMALRASAADSKSSLNLKCTLEVVHRVWSAAAPEAQGEPIFRDFLEEATTRSAPFVDGFVDLALPSKAGAFSAIAQKVSKSKARIDLHLTLAGRGQSSTTGWVNAETADFLQTERTDTLSSSDQRVIDMSCRLTAEAETTDRK